MKKITLTLLLLSPLFVFCQTSYINVDQIINGGLSHIEGGMLNLYYLEKYTPIDGELVTISIYENHNTEISTSLHTKVHGDNYIEIDISALGLTNDKLYRIVIDNINKMGNATLIIQYHST